MGQISSDNLSETYLNMRIGDKAKESDLPTKKKPPKHIKEIRERGRKRPLNLNGKYDPTFPPLFHLSDAS